MRETSRDISLAYTDPIRFATERPEIRRRVIKSHLYFDFLPPKVVGQCKGLILICTYLTHISNLRQSNVLGSAVRVSQSERRLRVVLPPPEESEQDDRVRGHLRAARRPLHGEQVAVRELLASPKGGNYPAMATRKQSWYLSRVAGPEGTKQT